MRGAKRVAASSGTRTPHGRRRRRLLACAAVVAAAAVGGAALAAAPGDPDASFGSGGTVVTGIDQHGDDAATAVAVQPDGKVVAAGRSGTSFAVVRYLSDGTLDTSFGGDGTVTTDFGGGLEARANGVALQPDGKIVVVGSARPPFNLGGEENGDLALARYEPDGDLDPAFGGDGRVTTELGQNEEGEDVAIQPDGRIVVAGSSGTQGFAVARYESDGDLDLTFGDDDDVAGSQTTDFETGGGANGKAVALGGGGTIVVAGFTSDGGGQTDFAIARYEADGDPDATFSADGMHTTDFASGSDDEANDVVVQPGGEIVAAGFTNQDFALARYESDGDLDTTFNGDGLVINSLGGDDRLNAVALSGTTIVGAGTTSSTGNGAFAVMRWEADGDPDPTFGGGPGFATADFDLGTADEAAGVAVQTGGEVVLAGVATPPFGSFEPEPGALEDFVLARHEADGDLDTTFGGDGKVETVVGDVFGDRGNGVAVQADGKIVVAGASIDEEGPDDPDFALVRYDADGTHDALFGDSGRVTADVAGGDLSDSGQAVAIQADGRIVVVGTAAQDVAVARFEADGDLDPTFSGDGRRTDDFGGGLDEARAVAIQPNGAIVVAGGSETGGLALARYESDGDPDLTFSGDGRLTDAAFSSHTVRGVAIQPDGAIVVAGGGPASGSEGLAVGRFEPDGDPDPTFGGDGVVVTDLSPTHNDFASAVALQPDGAIVAAGTAATPDTPVADCGGEPTIDVGVARYEPDGDLDPTFSGDGTQTTDFGDSFDNGHGIALEPDGRVAVAGRATNDLALARYEPDGDLDPDFSGDGRVTRDLGGCDVARAVALSQNGLLVAGYTRDAAGERFALARFLRSTPAAPAIAGTDPASPANDSTPRVRGSVGGGGPTTVQVFRNASCAGAADATGTVAQFTGAGIEVAVPDDATTQLSARALDGFGTESDCSAAVAYVEDSTPPDTVIDAGPEGTTSEAAPTFSFSATEPGSSFECRVDLAPFAPCSSPHTTAALAEGPHTFEVRAADQAGNLDATAAGRAFTVASPPAADDAVDGELSAPRRQRSLTRGTVVAFAECPSESCTAEASGYADIPATGASAARRFRFRRVRRELAAGQRARLVLRLPRRARGPLRRALRDRRSRRRVRATVVVRVTDAAGNRSQRRLRIAVPR